jgi:hypothetical protein
VASRSPLNTIRSWGASRNVVFGDHALDEARADKFFAGDVLHVLEHAAQVLAEDDEGLKWKAYGPTADGTEYAVVVNVHADHLWVVTCHFPP